MIKLNEIYNDDALVIMDKMIAEGIQVDLILTDPPYNITSRGNAGDSGGMFKKDISKKGKVFEYNDVDVKVWGKKIYQVLKDTGHCYIMTNHVNLKEYLNVLTGVGFHFIKCLIWDKCNKIMGQFYMSQFEYILFFRKGAGLKINNNGSSDILRVPNIKTKVWKGDNLHDTEKPVNLMRILIENSTKKNETVFDAFMGIGATCIASVLSKRNYIGVEIDEKYFNIAKKRIEMAKNEHELF